MEKGIVIIIVAPILILAFIFFIITSVITGILGTLSVMYIYDIPPDALRQSYNVSDSIEVLAAGKIYYDGWTTYNSQDFVTFSRSFNRSDFLSTLTDDDKELYQGYCKFYESSLDGIAGTKEVTNYRYEPVDSDYSGPTTDFGGVKYKRVKDGSSLVFSMNAVFPLSDEDIYHYEDDFGNERINDGSSTGHEGNDIFAKRNTPIFAIEDGTIEIIGWNGLGGWRINMVSKNGNRRYYYAHMEKFAEWLRPYQGPGKNVNITVKKGQLIGYVGSSGGFSSDSPIGTDTGTDPHIHLQIWVRHEGEEILIDPYKLLRFLESN